MSEDSDVYVLATWNPQEDKPAWSCCGCCMPPEKEVIDKGYTFDTRQEMLDHLLKHRAEGDKVPGRALERLRREIEEEIS